MSPSLTSLLFAPFATAVEVVCTRRSWVSNTGQLSRAEEEARPTNRYQLVSCLSDLSNSGAWAALCSCRCCITHGLFTNADVDAELAPAADTTATDAQRAVAAGTSNDPFEVRNLTQERLSVFALALQSICAIAAHYLLRKQHVCFFLHPVLQLVHTLTAVFSVHDNEILIPSR